MTPEQTKQLFILVLYEKINGKEPIHKGFRSINKNDYRLLTEEFAPIVEVYKRQWNIIERRFFKTLILDTMYYYCIVDAQKM